ncbi:MAG: NADP oxidoreductase [Candidatus Rokuibacteriota bacterium]|nr:MAG: NADP oxidoreductase [Candidatus Rokubacteria bacterium]
MLRRTDLVIDVDLLDRLPTPYGLVRAGVAPDHQKIKAVTATFDKTAAHPRFRFFGGVELGKHVDVEDLRAHYHQIAYTTGAQTDRRMGIPGEDLPGSHPATEFVAWYNGHPDYQGLRFDLSVECAVVIGNGNVALDVARMLALTPEELAPTDTTDAAIEALNAAAITEIVVVGRRGPAQASFTTPELSELGELAGADVIVDARRPAAGKPRRLTLRFLVSPVALTDSGAGAVGGIRLVRNRLVASATGTIQAQATDRSEDLPVGLVFRSVGYRGVPLPGVPFDDKWGVVLNEKGRVLDPDSKQPRPGEYTAGWIKRGPSGVIGTNKPDALETVTAMLEDLAAGRLLEPADAEPAAVERLLRQRQPLVLGYADWLRLNALEVARGQARGRPRVKFTRVDEMLAALGNRSSG